MIKIESIQADSSPKESHNALKKEKEMKEAKQKW